MSATLQPLRHLQRLAVAAAETGNHGDVGAPEKGDEYRVASGLPLQELMNDQIVVPDHGLDEADGGADFRDIGARPLESERVFDAAFHLHDFQERMIEQFFYFSIQQSVQVPKLINLHQVRIVPGELKIRILLEKQVADIV